MKHPLFRRRPALLATLIPALLHGVSVADETRLESVIVTAPALTEGQGWKSLRLHGLRYVLEADGREALYDLALDPAAYIDISSEPAYHEPLVHARHALLTRLLADCQPGKQVPARHVHGSGRGAKPQNPYRFF